MTHASRLLALVVLAVVAGRAAADEAQAMAAAERHVAAHEAAIVGELRELLALPNVATSPADIRVNADLLLRMLEKRGIAARILETPGAPVAVYGERRVPGAKRTLLFYAHFDGQPVGAGKRLEVAALRAGAARWAVPRTGRPWFPGPRRSTRCPMRRAFMRARRATTRDRSSPCSRPSTRSTPRRSRSPRTSSSSSRARRRRVRRTSRARSRRIAAFSARISGSSATGRSTRAGCRGSSLGVRGVTGFRLTVYGPATSLHSGHYGNVAPNPGARLAALIASMRAADGGITIGGLEAPAPTAETLELARTAFDTPRHARVRGDRRDRERPRLRRVRAAALAQRDPAALRRRGRAAERDRRGGDGGFRPPARAGHDGRGRARGHRGACRKAGLRPARCAADGRGAREAPAARALRMGRRRLSGGDVGSGEPGRRARDRGDARGDRGRGAYRCR